MQDINKLIKECDNDNKNLVSIFKIISNITNPGSVDEMSDEVILNMINENNMTMAQLIEVLSQVSSGLKGGGSEKVLYMDNNHYLYTDEEKTTRISASRLRSEFESGFYIYTGTTTNYRALTCADAIDSNKNRYAFVVILTIDGTITKAYSSEYEPTNE